MRERRTVFFLFHGRDLNSAAKRLEAFLFLTLVSRARHPPPHPVQARRPPVRLTANPRGIAAMLHHPTPMARISTFGAVFDHLRETVRRLPRNLRISARRRRGDRPHRHFPRDLWPRNWERLGLARPSRVPKEEYGGTGMGYPRALSSAVGRLSRGSASVGLSYGDPFQTSCINQIRAQRQPTTPKSANTSETPCPASHVGSSPMSESGAGFPTSLSMRQRPAERRGDRYISTAPRWESPTARRRETLGGLCQRPTPECRARAAIQAAFPS